MRSLVFVVLACVVAAAWAQSGQDAPGSAVTEAHGGDANAVVIAAGELHSLAVDGSGRVWAWGSNAEGQLGNRDVGGSTVPVLASVAPGTTIVSVAAGRWHSLAFDGEGHAWAWGTNEDGQLGDGSTAGRGEPVPVVMPPGVVFHRISAGSNHSLALDQEGRIWAWGRNSHGQLGDGSRTARTTPSLVRMPSGVAFANLALGWAHSLAVDSSGGVWGWGENGSGHIGDASRVNRPAPVRAQLPNGVTAGRVRPFDGRVHAEAVWDERFRLDWGRFGTQSTPGVPRATGFEGIVSETGVSLTYAPSGEPGSWIIDVTVSAEHPRSPSISEDVAFVSVFPLGVVSLAVPEPLWVDYGGIVLEVFDEHTGSWIGVQDSYRRPGAEASLWDWVDGAFLAVDVLSLAVPKLQLLKLLLMLPWVMEEYKEAEWDSAFDPTNVVPSEGPFVDPNAFRVVQVPWRFDGLERYSGESAWGGSNSPNARDPWSRLPLEGGVVPVRVRVPVTSASEEELAAARAFVVVTEEHTIYGPVPVRSPLTATTAAPLPLPSRVVAASPERTSISRYALRVVGERGLRRASTSGEALSGTEVAPHPELGTGEWPTAVVPFGRVGVGSLSGAWYESAAGFEVEATGSDVAAFVVSLEAEPGPEFSSFAAGYTVSFDDGVAYLAIPNVPGLRVGYDETRIEVYNVVSGEWDVVLNEYVGPARTSAPTAATRAVRVTSEVMIGEALSAMGGHGIARTLVAINIAKELGALNDSAVDTALIEAPVVVPLEPAFYDPNRFRLIEIPWQLSRLMPRGDSGDPGVFLYADPRDPASGGMRLRIVVPVAGLPPERFAESRAFASSVERVVAWTTPIIGPPRQQAFRTRVVTAPTMATMRGDTAPNAAASEAFVRVAAFVPDASLPNGFFARGIALVGDSVFVGAPSDIYDGAPEVVVVYERSGDAWREVERLPSPGDPLFGGIVAADGDLLAVAATFYGSTSVYRRSAAGSWQVADRVGGGDGALVIDAPHVIVGHAAVPSLHDTEEMFGPGEVRVVRFDASTVDRVARLRAPWPRGGDLFGAALAVDDLHLLVSAPMSQRIDQDLPAEVHVFARDDWQHLGRLGPMRSGVGPAVALGAGVAFAAVRNDSGAVEGIGLFVPAAGDWPLAARIDPPEDVRERDGFGTAITFVGGRLFVGAPGVVGSHGSGEVFVYREDAGTWKVVARLSEALAPDDAAHGFGRRIAVDGDRVLVAGSRTAHLFEAGTVSE